MNRRKFILFFLVFLLSFSARYVFAYNIDTHAYLADETLSFYNKNFSSNTIIGDLKNYLLDGARREDDGIRSFNHFYDPVNNIGFHDVILGTWEKSKDWVSDSRNQNDLKYKVPAVIASVLSAVENGKISDISTESDFTWKKAVELYAKGEKEKAFFLLGHIVHLIEDASVPDHTRNDPHLGDSPYENWTDQFKLQNKDSNLSARLSDKTPIQLDNLSSYFDGLATYSNNNFYSKDTIGIGGYKSPEPDYFGIEEDGKSYGIKIDEGFGDYPIIKASGLLASNNSELLNRPIIMLQYWSRLSTKAVQYGAGVINLFVKEAEAAKNDPNLNKQTEQKSFIASIASGAQNIFSAIGGAIQKAANALQGILKQNDPQINNPQIEEPQTNLPTKIPINETIENIPTEIDSELVAAEQIKEDVELLPMNQETSFTETEKAVIAQMIARLNDLMKQAVELKIRVEAASIPANKSSGNQIVIVSSGGGGGSYATINNEQTSQSNTHSSSSNNSNTTTTTATATTTTTTATSTNSNATSTATSTVTNTATSTATSTANITVTSTIGSHVLISEVMAGESGAANSEWVELYNPTGQIVSLDGWSLKRRSNFTTTSTLNLVSAGNFSGSIASGGFFLVASQEWAGVKNPDLRYSQSSNHLAHNEDVVALYDAAGDLIDEVYYLNIDSGKSLERKAKSSNGNCVSAVGAGEFLGNGCEATSTSATEIRTVPNPQNSLSLPEPRQAPGLSGAAVSYSSSSISLNFGWNESADALGATSTIVYEIKNASSSEIFATTTGVLSFARGINEIGRDYNFTLRAVDRDGLGSATTSLAISVPSFFDKLYLYPDPRHSGQYALDAYYDHYPLIPGDSGMWEAAVFYLNADPSPEAYFPDESAASSALTLIYPTCSAWGSDPSPHKSLILPFGSNSCAGTGGGTAVSAFPGATEDLHFIIQASKSDGSDFSSGDYITAAFYQFGGGYQPNGFYFRITDKKKIDFRETAPTSTPPEPPSDISFGSFDDLHSVISFSWPSAHDADTPDSSLAYEYNYTTSTEFADNAWHRAGAGFLSANAQVVFPNSYKIGVRAVDDFGNISLPIVRDWNNFPAGFVVMPSQSDSSQIIGRSDGGGQKVLISTASSISKIEMMMGNGGGGSRTQVFMEIYSDANGARGELIATSTPVEEVWPMEDHPSKRLQTFNFSQPVVLSGGNYYWLVPVTSAYGLSSVYGSSIDAYPDGFWSDNPNMDAYLFMR